MRHLAYEHERGRVLSEGIYIVNLESRATALGSGIVSHGDEVWDSVSEVGREAGGRDSEAARRDRG